MSESEVVGAEPSPKRKHRPAVVDPVEVKPLTDDSGNLVWANVDERLLRAKRLNRQVYNAMRDAVESVSGKADEGLRLEKEEAVRKWGLCGSELGRVNAENSGIKIQMEGLRDELEASCSKIKELNEANAKMAAHIRENAGRIAGLQDLNRSLTDEVSALKKGRSPAKDLFENSIRAKDEQIETLQAILKKRDEEVKALDSSVAETAAKARDIEGRMAVVESERDALAHELAVADLKGSLVDSLRARVERLQKEQFMLVEAAKKKAEGNDPWGV